jgi:putative exosortase-associated protein (TIGR04073 family)
MKKIPWMIFTICFCLVLVPSLLQADDMGDSQESIQERADHWNYEPRPLSHEMNSIQSQKEFERLYDETKWDKFGRGATNATTGYYEIIHQFQKERESKPYSVALFGGMAKGFFYGTKRTFVGLYEVFTFPWKNHDGKDYTPLMEPHIVIPGFEPSESSVPRWGQKSALY